MTLMGFEDECWKIPLHRRSSSTIPFHVYVPHCHLAKLSARDCRVLWKEIEWVIHRQLRLHSQTAWRAGTMEIHSVLPEERAKDQKGDTLPWGYRYVE